MGTEITSWDAYLAAMGSEEGPTGAIYTGVGSGEMIWLIASIALCIFALWVGSRHELDAYKKAEK